MVLQLQLLPKVLPVLLLVLNPKQCGCQVLQGPEQLACALVAHQLPLPLQLVSAGAV
jgi:hypothetical protein